jgi:hypothetical protein
MIASGYGLDIEKKTTEFQITPRVVFAQHRLDELQKDTLTDDAVKELLVGMLLKELKKGSHIEFTKMLDHADGSMLYKARICVMDSSQITLLRKNNMLDR